MNAYVSWKEKFSECIPKSVNSSKFRNKRRKTGISNLLDCHIPNSETFWSNQPLR